MMKLAIVILILVIDLIHNKRIFWQHDGNKELMLSVIRELPDYLRQQTDESLRKCWKVG